MPTLLLALLLLLVPGAASGQGSLPLEYREDPASGLGTVVPTGWTALGQGIHARLPDASDTVLLAAQSAPVPIDQLWASLLPQLLLEEPPEPVGTRTTDHFDWTLYQVDVPVPSGTVRVDLALAEDAGTSYLVLFQAPAEEAEALSAEVFLPAVDAFVVLDPEPTPDPATLPFTAEEVSFAGGDPDVTLAGTFTVPRTPGPHPAVVLLGGSGPQDRDESLRPVSAIKPLALLADALSAAGVAVLRYDDRGVAASTGDFAAATLADFTADAAAALAWLRERPEVDAERVGALGHSEGGVYIASLIEAGEPLAFAIGLASPATNGVDLLIAQNGAIVRSSGGTEEEAELAEAFAAELYAAVLADDDVAVERSIRDYFTAFYDRQTAAVQATLGDREAFVDGQLRTQLAAVGQGWYVDLLRSDAGVGWAMATMPVLGVFAARDVQVLADQNAPLMEAQLADGHPASRVVTLPDANHLFQAAESGSLAEYGTLEPVFTPELLPLLVEWVAGVTGVDAPEASPAAR